MRVLSLFDGISCARVALERLGYKDITYYASEIDKYAIQIAQKNYPDTIQVGSIIDLKGEDFKDIDLMIGGSPCQDLSIAKKNREGLKGSRSGLFYEFVRLLNEVKPKYWVLENVNSMSKESKAIITEELGVEPVMINAALVSAQNRKRLFWTNIRGDGDLLGAIPLPEDRGILLKDIIETGEVDRIKSYAIDANYFKGGNIKSYKKGRRQQVFTNRIGSIGKGGQGDRIYSTDGKSVNLSANGGGRGAKTGLYLVSKKHTEAMKRHNKRFKTRDLDGKTTAITSTYYKVPSDGNYLSVKQIERLKYLKGAKKEKRVKNGFEYTFSEGALKLTQTDKSLPLLASGGNSISRTTNFIEDEMMIRKLTPVECERLMTLPDGYTEGVSNTQRYKALGNGFVVEVVKHILGFMKLN